MTEDRSITDCIQFIDKDDCRVLLLGESERISDKFRTITDEHLDELRTGQFEECRLCLSGTGSSQQGLAGAGRTIQQYT